MVYHKRVKYPNSGHVLRLVKWHFHETKYYSISLIYQIWPLLMRDILLAWVVYHKCGTYPNSGHVLSPLKWHHHEALYYFISHIYQIWPLLMRDILLAWVVWAFWWRIKVLFSRLLQLDLELVSKLLNHLSKITFGIIREYFHTETTHSNYNPTTRQREMIQTVRLSIRIMFL